MLFHAGDIDFQHFSQNRYSTSYLRVYSKIKHNESVI